MLYLIILNLIHSNANLQDVVVNIHSLRKNDTQRESSQFSLFPEEICILSNFFSIYYIF